MYFRAVFLPFLLVSLSFQTPSDTLKHRYQEAEALRRSGDLVGAETKFAEILAESYHKLGRVYSAQNNYQGSVAVLEASVTYGPRSHDALVDLAIAYFYTQQYKRAVEPLNQALIINSRSVAAHHMMGKAYFMQNDFEKSTSELEIAMKLSPRDYDVAYTLGLAYLKRRQLVPAKRIFDRMILQLGNRPQLRVLIGRGYRETGFLSEAIEEFKKAVALDPRFPRVHYYLGLTYLLKDGAVRLSEAEAEFKIELAEHPEEFFANYYLGIVATIERKWDPALAFLKKASQIQPKNPDPYFYLGQAYQGLGRHEEAIEVLRKSIAFNPDLRHNDYQVTNAHYRLAQSLMKVGQTEEGKKELQIAAELKTKAFKRDEAKAETFINAADLNAQSEFPELVPAQSLVLEPKAPEGARGESLKSDASFYQKVIASAHNNIGLLRAERQDFRKASEHFQLATKWDPSLEGVNYNLGLAQYKAGSFKEALMALENEINAHPTNLAAKQLLGLSYFMTENFEKAAALLTEVVAVKPNDATLYYPLALSLGKLGKTEEVNKVVQQMLTFGKTPEIHILIARAYYEQGAGEKALEELQAALSLDSKAPRAHFYSGLVHLKMGKFVDAAREFEAELTLNSADQQAKYHLGYVLLANQETKRGMQLLREVIQSQPDFSNAYFELGKAQLQQGDVQGSVKNLEAAARLTPDQAHIHYQLGRAYVAAGRQAEGELQFERSKQLKDKARSQTNP